MSVPTNQVRSGLHGLWVGILQSDRKINMTQNDTTDVEVHAQTHCLTCDKPSTTVLCPGCFALAEKNRAAKSKTTMFPVGARVSFRGREGVVVWRPSPDCVGVKFDGNTQGRSYHPDNLVAIGNEPLAPEIAARFAHVEITDD